MDMSGVKSRTEAVSLLFTTLGGKDAGEVDADPEEPGDEVESDTEDVVSGDTSEEEVPKDPAEQEEATSEKDA